MATSTERDLLRSLLDREEIRAVLHRYAKALDHHDRKLFEAVLTEDVLAHYPPGGRYASRVEFLDEVLPFLREKGALVGSTQHLLCNELIELAGDQAKVNVQGHVPGTYRFGDGLRVVTTHVSYDVELQRCPDGWRISFIQVNPISMDDEEVARALMPAAPASP